MVAATGVAVEKLLSVPVGVGDVATVGVVFGAGVAVGKT
jgi:hypothetical protein